MYFYNTAVENNFLIIKLSFSDFILFYNSENRHLEFLNLSPQGLISSILYIWPILAAREESVKFMYSEKATKICENNTVDLS